MSILPKLTSSFPSGAALAIKKKSTSCRIWQTLSEAFLPAPDPSWMSDGCPASGRLEHQEKASRRKSMSLAGFRGPSSTCRECGNPSGLSRSIKIQMRPSSRWLTSVWWVIFLKSCRLSLRRRNEPRQFKSKSLRRPGCAQLPPAPSQSSNENPQLPSILEHRHRQFLFSVSEFPLPVHLFVYRRYHATENPF